MKTVLITGGAGFIGSNLCRKLVKIGYDVIILDNFSRQIHGKDYLDSEAYVDLSKKVRILKGDVTKKRDLKLAFNDIDAIIHFAAETGTGQSMYAIDKYAQTNIKGTSLLLDLVAKSKNTVKKIVVASSRAIYGEGKYHCVEHGIQFPARRDDEKMRKGVFNPCCKICEKELIALPTDESSMIAPSSIYGVTKYAQEQMALIFGKVTGIPTIALRFQNVFGPGQSLKNPYTGILSIFSTSMILNNKIEIFEDGLESRDFVFIDDVVDATVKALESQKTDNMAINIGTGVPTTVMDIAKKLRDIYGSKSEIVLSGKYRIGDIRHNMADLGLAKSVLGFEPQISFNDGLKKFSEWVITQKISNDGYQKSLNELKRRGLYK